MVQVTAGASKKRHQPGAPGVKVIASQFECKHHPEVPVRRPIDPSLLNRPPIKETVHAVMRAAAAASQPRGKSTAVDPVLTSSSRSTVREAARQVAAAGTQVEKNKRAAGPAVLEAIRYAAARGLPVKVAARQVIAAAEMERNRRVVGPEVVEAVRYASAMELPVKVAAAYHEGVIAELRKMQLPALSYRPPAWTSRSCSTHDGAAEDPLGRCAVDGRQPPKSSPAALRGPADEGGDQEDGSAPPPDGPPSLRGRRADGREDDNDDAGSSLRNLPPGGRTDDVENRSPDDGSSAPNPRHVATHYERELHALFERAGLDARSGEGPSAQSDPQPADDLDAVAERVESGATRPAAERALSPPDPSADPAVMSPQPNYGVSYSEDHEHEEEGAPLVPSIIDLITYALDQLTDWDSEDDELFGDGLEIMDISARAQGVRGGCKHQTVVEHDAFIIEEEDVRAAIERAEVARRQIQL